MNNLVEYSSSSDEEPLDEPKKQEIELNQSEVLRKRKLPVPSFLTRTTKIQKTDDNPTDHQGRQRAIAHERGIWATYLFIPIPALDAIEETQNRIKDFCEEKLLFNLELMENFHVSVTKLLILKHHWIQSFIDTVSEKVRGLSSFSIGFGEIEIYCNEEKTRTFLGIKTIDVAQLLELTGMLDDCLEEFKLPKYYEDPSFHASILWSLGDKSEILKEKKSELQEMYENILVENNFQVSVHELLCKCGNRSYRFPFR